MSKDATENKTGQEESSPSEDKATEPVISGDTVSTIEFTEAESAEDATPAKEEPDPKDKTSDDDTSDDDTVDDDAKDTGKLSAEDMKKLDVTFQDSPRFKQLTKQNRELREQAIRNDERIKALETRVNSGDEGGADDSLSFKDIMEMDNDSIAAAMDKDPKGFLANYGRQLYAEIMSEIDAKGQADSARTQEEKIKARYAKYEEDNPDFTEMWDSGKIKEFMDQNPGETPISAHKALTEEKRIKDAVNKAVKEATEGLTKQAKTKKKARVISGGPADAAARESTRVPAELQDTKKHGGLLKVLVNRSRARMTNR